MAEIGRITPNTRFVRTSRTGATLLSHALAIAWIVLVYLGLGVPPHLLETVSLGEGLTIYAPALEASLRWSFDHMPHIDYHTQTGIAFWLAQGIGVELAGLHPKSVLFANLLTAAVIALAAYFLIKPRLSALMIAVLMTGMASLTLSLRPFGADGGTIGGLGGPERTALALASTLFVTFFLEPRSERKPLEAALESIIVASLLVWLVFLDAYIATIVMVSGLAALAFPSASRGLILESMTFAALACVGLGFLFGFGLPYLADIQGAIAAAPLFQVEKMIDQIQANAIALAVVVGALLLSVLINLKNRQLRSDTIGVTIVLLFAAVLAVNRIDTPTLPLAVTILIVLAARSYLNLPRGDQKSVFRMLGKIIPAYLPALIAALALVTLQVQADITTLDRYVDIQRTQSGSVLCDAPEHPACDIRITAPQGATAITLPPPQIGAAGTDDGAANACGDDMFCLRRTAYAELIGLLNANMQDGDTPLLLSPTNPVPYLYGIAPPRSVYSDLTPGRTVSLKHHPSANSLFVDVSLLAVPKPRTNPNFEPALGQFYDGGMTRMFDVVAETGAWSLYRKKPVN